MTLWLILALMTAGTIFSVLWPVSRRGPLRGGSDIAVYRDQLDEIERDRASGLIGEREAEAARVEGSRRLIGAARAGAPAAAAGPRLPSGCCCRSAPPGSISRSARRNCRGSRTPNAARRHRSNARSPIW